MGACDCRRFHHFRRSLNPRLIRPCRKPFAAKPLRNEFPEVSFGCQPGSNSLIKASGVNGCPGASSTASATTSPHLSPCVRKLQHLISPDAFGAPPRLRQGRHSHHPIDQVLDTIGEIRIFVLVGYPPSPRRYIRQSERERYFKKPPTARYDRRRLYPDFAC